MSVEQQPTGGPPPGVLTDKQRQKLLTEIGSVLADPADAEERD